MGEKKLILALGQMIDEEESENIMADLEVYVDGEWHSLTVALPTWQYEALQAGRINKIASDDSEEVAARIPE